MPTASVDVDPGPIGDTFSDSFVQLSSGVTLSVRQVTTSPPVSPAELTGGRGRFLLVHGLASNAQLWDGVSRRLVAAGHDVVAVDQRGHGRSPAPSSHDNRNDSAYGSRNDSGYGSGYDTMTCAEDLADLAATLGWTGDRAPIMVGQSWGGNVVLTCAAQHHAASAIALIDGGWIAVGRQYATFDECWQALAPPSFDGTRYDDLADSIRSWHPDWPAEGIAGTLANLTRTPDGGVRAVLAREHHRQILHSLWANDPADLYPQVQVPTLLLPAGSPDDSSHPVGSSAAAAAVTKASAISELIAGVGAGGLAQVSWYPGAHHDLHAQHPGRVAADLLGLAARASAHRSPVPDVPATGSEVSANE